MNEKLTEQEIRYALLTYALLTPTEISDFFNSVRSDAWERGYRDRQADFGAVDRTPNPYGGAR